MKKHQNAKIVAMVDNRYRGNLRQYLGAIWFRLYLKKYFDAVLVPGKSGQKLMKFLGMDPSRIYTGLYGAYEGIFNETNPIEIRNKEFLFVGQLIERKSVDVLIDAFKAYRQAGGAWHLRLVGDGPLKDICTGDGIILESFTEPKEIARKMNQARVLVLVSRDDNWGTVVCEGAACGK
jgi:glycosyltransferase involved in cell wall biosynthesis